jgi:hypothetical protein
LSDGLAQAFCDPVGAGSGRIKECANPQATKGFGWAARSS